MKVLTQFSIVSFLVSGMILVCGILPIVAADPIVGIWKGDVYQPGYGTYPVVMNLTATGGGTIDYPSLGCGGTLSGGGSGGVYNFTEKITYGKCIDAGSVRVVQQGDYMFWEWSGTYQSKSYYVSGKLYRSGPPPPTRTCAECGDALMSAVDYGLQRSQNLRNYVHEARQSYANCIRDIQGGCQYTCGRQLYDNLPACDQFNESGFRACVETDLNGARLSCP